MNILFIIFQFLAFIGYILAAPALYKTRQLSIKNIFILFFWLNITWPIFFYKFGKDLIIYIKILAVLLSLYIMMLLSIFISKLGVLFAVKAAAIANNLLFRYLIQPIFFLGG